MTQMPQILALPLVLLLAAPPNERTAAEVQHLVATIGPTQTLAELDRNDGGWVSVLAGIESGKQEWLAVAGSLYQFADGGSADDLNDAVQDALLRNPTGVLDLVEHKRLPPDSACGGYGSGLVDAPREVLLAAIDGRIKRIGGLRGELKESVRQTCLDELDKLRDFIARFAP